MPSAIQTQGVVISVSSGSPTTWTAIGNITDFSGPGGTASIIDISNLDSIMKEKMTGLPDEGQLSFNINLDPDNASHLLLKTIRTNRTRAEFKITLTDTTPTVLTFFGYVLGYVLSGGVDAAVKAAITIEIDGVVAWA
jgi:hypothetical protein